MTPNQNPHRRFADRTRERELTHELIYDQYNEMKALPLPPVYVQNPRLLFVMLHRFANYFIETAEEMRQTLIAIYGCDPRGQSARPPSSFPDKDPQLCMLLHMWDIYDRRVLRARDIIFSTTPQDDLATLRGAVDTLVKALYEEPLEIQDRIIDPLYPAQKEVVAFDLAGWLAPKIRVEPPADPKTKWNKRLFNVLNEDLVEGETRHDALLQQLPSAVIAAVSDKGSSDLKELRGAVSRLIERGEPDAGRKTPLTDEMLITIANDEPAFAESEEFAARDEATRDERWKESLAELRASAMLSKTEDRVLDMYLEYMPLAEIARNLGATKNAKQVEQHLVAIRRKIARAAGIAA